MNINTKEGIDFKYLLFSDIIDIKNIPKINEVKTFKGSVGEFEQKIDSNSKEKKEADSPDIFINCNHLRILKNRDE